MDMTREDLFRAIGEAEDPWVEAAGAPLRAANRRRWPIAVAAALVVGLVACGVQQGWFQFLTPEQWRGSAHSTEESFVYQGSVDLGAQTVHTSISCGGRQVQFPSLLLKQDAFRQRAADHGWALNWAALEELGKFSGTETPCWDASQLEVDRSRPSRILLAGTPQETPLKLNGTWLNGSRASVTVSFALADGQEPPQFRIQKDTALTQLEAAGWNEAVFLSDEAGVGQGAAVALAWRSLDEPCKNTVTPEHALEDPPQAQDMDRCVLMVYFQGYAPEEALRLAKELLKGA